MCVCVCVCVLQNSLFAPLNPPLFGMPKSQLNSASAVLYS